MFDTDQFQSHWSWKFKFPNSSTGTNIRQGLFTQWIETYLKVKQRGKDLNSSSRTLRVMSSALASTDLKYIWSK